MNNELTAQFRSLRLYGMGTALEELSSRTSQKPL